MGKANAVSRRDFVTGSAAAAASLVAAQGMATAVADEAARGYESTISWNGIYDVVVVGFGGAGAVASVAAADKGAKVLLLDKAPEGHEGGNTRYCAQMLNWIHPELIEEGVGYFKALRGNNLEPSDDQIRAFVTKMSENYDWLLEKGADVVIAADLYGIEQYYGEYPEFAGGEANEQLMIGTKMMMSQFWKFFKELVSSYSDSIDVWYESPATRIIRDPSTGIVLGVTVDVDGEEANIRARNGVVLSCGGFENNQQMIQDYTSLTECFAAGSQYNTGDGIRMAAEIGARLWNMDLLTGPYLGTYRPGASRPEFFSGTNFAASYYKGGFIMVGPDGTRFQNEVEELNHGYRKFHGTWVLSPAPQPCYLVFDRACVNESVMLSQSMVKDVSRQVEEGYVKQADSIAELAEMIGINPEALEATVGRWNGYCETGLDVEFGRGADYDSVHPLLETTGEGSLVPIGDGPYYATELKPFMFNTQGGPARNAECMILDVNNEPIPHLYGAGECGETFSHLYQGGSNLGDDVASGRTAGENAAITKEDGQPAADLVIDIVSPGPKAEPVYECAEGEYIGVGEGICGPLYAKVKVAEDGTVESVEILDNMETDTFGGNAIELMPERFVGLTADEVFDVDGCTWATFTSVAIRTAVADALAQA